MGVTHFSSIALTDSGVKGTRTIATGGSGVVSSSAVTADSVIVLSPKVGTSGYYKTARAVIKSQTAGSFKVMLTTGHATAATGAVNWAIIG